MKEISLGVLGGGRMAWEHCRQIVETPGLRLAGLSSRSEDARRSAGEQFPEIDLYPEHEKLLETSGIEWVVITTFTNEHKEWALKALERGKNLIIEKPITLNAPDAEEIFSTAKRENLRVTVHQNRRWDRDFQLIKTILEDNLLGDVYRIESRVCYSSEAWAGWGAEGMQNPWRLKKGYGGGILSDWGSHLFDQLVTGVSDRVKEVYGHLESRVWSEEVEDHFYADLRFEDGRSAWVEASNNHSLPLPRWFLLGTKGTLTVSGGIPEQWGLATLRRPYRDFAREEHIDIHQDEFSPGFYADFASRVISGKEPSVCGEEVVLVSRIIDAVRESSEIGRVIAL
ncbi:MAG: Gfo/Idh/MocA family protein [Spirochaetaceae bacterium]